MSQYGEDVAEEAQYLTISEHQRVERTMDQRHAVSDVLPPVRSLQLGPTSQIAQQTGNPWTQVGNFIVKPYNTVYDIVSSFEEQIWVYQGIFCDFLDLFTLNWNYLFVITILNHLPSPEGLLDQFLFHQQLHSPPGKTKLHQTLPLTRVLSCLCGWRGHLSLTSTC